MTDTSIRAMLEAFWDARVVGDKETMNSFLAPGATYEMTGAGAFADRGTVGPHDMRLAAAQLADTFVFHSGAALANPLSTSCCTPWTQTWRCAPVRRSIGRRSGGRGVCGGTIVASSGSKGIEALLER